MTSKSTPPPATNLVILAGDLVASAARNLLDQLACGTWEPAARLRQALDAYECARTGDEITNAQDPQACTVADWPVPQTERSVHHA